MMAHPEEKADRFDQQLDRFLLAASTPIQPLSPEDEPELALGVELLQADFSHQSKLRAQLRRYLETERGVQSNDPSKKLAKAAASRRRATIQKLSYWPALLAIVILIGIWSWTSATFSIAVDKSNSQPSPALVITAVMAASRQPADADPRPVPTPLASPMTRAQLTASKIPAAQHTPFGLFSTSPEATNP